MRNKLMILGVIFSIMAGVLPQVSFAAEQAGKKQVTAKDLQAPPDATITFEASQMRLIIGGAEGKGVLSFKGKDYPFTMKAVSLGGVGATAVEGTGTVHYLKNVEDFAGMYNGIGAGAAVVAGKGGSSFENAKGVVVTTKSKASGAALNLGVSSVTVTLVK